MRLARSLTLVVLTLGSSVTSAYASSIVYTFDLSTGQSDEPGVILSFTPNGTGGTVLHHISTLSPTLLVDTATGAVIPSASLSGYDGAISPLLKIGEYDFTNLVFTSVQHPVVGGAFEESFTFQSAGATFTPGPSCASQENIAFSLSTGESTDSVHSLLVRCWYTPDLHLLA